VKKRWREYFERLLNEEYPKQTLECISRNKGLISIVSGEEKKAAVRLMKKKKL